MPPPPDHLLSPTPSSSEPQKLIPIDFSSTDSRLLCDTSFHLNGSSDVGGPGGIGGNLPPPIVTSGGGLHPPTSAASSSVTAASAGLPIPLPLGLEPPPPPLGPPIGLQALPPVSLQALPPINLQTPVVPEPGSHELHHHYVQVGYNSIYSICCNFLDKSIEHTLDF